jgi:hypothetical protein
MIKINRLYPLIIFLSILLLSAACGGGGGGGSDSSSPAAASVTGNSTSQAQFLARRGNPDLFTLGFIDEELQNGRPVAVTPRRIETWMYNQEQATGVLFDNGYFVKEETYGPAQNLVPTNLSPTQFRPGMSKAEVVSFMGNPSCEQSFEMGGRTYTTMRYAPTTSRPVNSVVLENGVVTSVVAGYAVVAPGESVCP